MTNSWESGKLICVRGISLSSFLRPRLAAECRTAWSDALRSHSPACDRHLNVTLGAIACPEECGRRKESRREIRNENHHISASGEFFSEELERMTDPRGRRKMISLRLSEMEYEVLKKQYRSYGARIASGESQPFLPRQSSTTIQGLKC